MESATIPFPGWSAIQWQDITPARRPGAGWGHPRHDVVGPRAGGGLLGGKDPAGRLRDL
jgi:hypothetical protein